MWKHLKLSLEVLPTKWVFLKNNAKYFNTQVITSIDILHEKHNSLI
jgi:hypothetical protein